MSEKSEKREVKREPGNPPISSFTKEDFSGMDVKVINDIIDERCRQFEKWGQQNHHPFVWLAILGEEFGEAQKACLEAEFASPVSARPSKQQWIRLREELVQTTAVAEAMIESLDRNQLSE